MRHKTKLTLFFLILFLPFSAKAETEEELRKCYVDELIAAFHMQANTRSYNDSYSACVKFNCAKDKLSSMGEPECKINAVKDLWQWYRTYGYNSGFMLNPVQCPGEYISNKRYIQTKPLDPKQQRTMREFLLGVGSMVSGIFCVAVNAPLLSGKVGWGLITFGAERMWESINEMVMDYEERKARQQELKEIQAKAEAILKK